MCCTTLHFDNEHRFAAGVSLWMIHNESVPWDIQWKNSYRFFFAYIFFVGGLNQQKAKYVDFFFWAHIRYLWLPTSLAQLLRSSQYLAYKKQPLQWSHGGRNGVSNHQPHDSLLNRFFRRRSKKTSKLHVTGLCAGNSPVTGEFPAQMASSAENVFIWWRHHAYREYSVHVSCFCLMQDAMAFMLKNIIYRKVQSRKWLMRTSTKHIKQLSCAIQSQMFSIIEIILNLLNNTIMMLWRPSWFSDRAYVFVDNRGRKWIVSQQFTDTVRYHYNAVNFLSIPYKCHPPPPPPPPPPPIARPLRRGMGFLLWVQMLTNFLLLSVQRNLWYHDIFVLAIAAPGCI